MSDFTPVTVGSADPDEGTDQITVSTYRSVIGGKHFVHLAASDGSSLYLSGQGARSLATALDAAAVAVHAAEQAEHAETGQ